MNEIINRCRWVNMKNPLYIQYHDTEWGIPQHADHMLFELLILEGFQAGLSWECVLNKRVMWRRSAAMTKRKCRSCWLTPALSATV